jgi:hypothetical protein
MSFMARIVRRSTITYALFAANLLGFRSVIEQQKGKFDPDIARTVKTDQEDLDAVYKYKFELGPGISPRSDVVVPGDNEDFYRFPIRVDPTYGTPNWRENGTNPNRCATPTSGAPDRKDYAYDKFPRIISYDGHQKLVYPNGAEGNRL